MTRGALGRVLTPETLRGNLGVIERSAANPVTGEQAGELRESEKSSRSSPLGAQACHER
jgi:hypothetical protein